MSISNKATSMISTITANKPLRLLLIAVGLAALAAYLAMKYLEIREAELQRAYLRSDEQTVRVIVPKTDLPAGSVISGSTVASRPVPAVYVHRSAVRASEFDQIKGRRITSDIERGTPLLWDYVAGSKRNDFSDVLQDGRRAITVQVDQINSINGMIEPGNDIDLYVTMDGKFLGGKEGDAIFPIIQKVRVLATGRRLDPKVQATMLIAYSRRREASFNTVTIDVSPREAALVFAAQSSGTLSALLRNREDTGMAKFGHISPDQLFSLSQKIAQQKEQAAQKNLAGNAAVTRVVRDKEGNVIGVDDGKGNLIDPTTGKIVAKRNTDGSYSTDDGTNLGKADATPLSAQEAQQLGLTEEKRRELGLPASDSIADEENSITAPAWLVEFLSGGNSKNGVAIVQKLPVQ